MSKCNDLTGKRFGRLFVIKRVGGFEKFAEWGLF